MDAPCTEVVKQRISAIWENLQCPICLDLMSLPVTTKCDHQFCKFCMQKLLDRAKRQQANCPVCKTKITKRSLQDSSAFEKLVAALQNLVEAYEYDTGTNYFTGLPQRKKSESDETEQRTEEIPKPERVLSANESVQSISSSQAAKEAFAQLMNIGDSCSLTSDSGLGHLQASKTKALCSSEQTMDCLPIDNDDVVPNDLTEHDAPSVSKEADSTECVENIVVHNKRQTRSSRLQVAKQLLENEEVVITRKSTRSTRRLGVDFDRLVDGRQKRSLEKVSEWLLGIPPEEQIDEDDGEKNQSYKQGNQSDDDTLPQESNSSSDSHNPVKMMEEPANHVVDRLANPRQEAGKALEEKVFGAVYSRGRRTRREQSAHRSSPERAVSIGLCIDPEPSQAVPTETPVAQESNEAVQEPDIPSNTCVRIKGRRRSSSLTPSDFILKPTPAETQKADEGEAKDCNNHQLVEEGKVQCSDKSKCSGQQTQAGGCPANGDPEPESKTEPENNAPDIEGQGEHGQDGLLFEVKVRRRGRSRAKMQDAWADLDSALNSEVQEKQPKGQETGRNNKDERLSEKKSSKGPKGLELVSAEGQCCPVEVNVVKTQRQDSELQIESYPSSEELHSPVARVTRRNKRLMDFTVEVQGPRPRTRSTKLSVTEEDHSKTPHTGPDNSSYLHVEGDHEAQGRARASRSKALTTPSASVSRDEPHPAKRSPVMEGTGNVIGTEPNTTSTDGGNQTPKDPMNNGSTRATLPIECLIHSAQSPVSVMSLTNPGSLMRRLQEDGNIAPHTPLNQAGVAPRWNGCVYERAMDSIEEMEVEEPSGQTEIGPQSSAAVVPHTQMPTPSLNPLVAPVNPSSLQEAVVPYSRSPAEAVVPFSPPDLSGGQQRSPPTAGGASEPGIPVEPQDSSRETPARESSSIEVQEENDSELDTELLLRSFKSSKRRSFHLGSPRQQSKARKLGSPTNTLMDALPDSRPNVSAGDIAVQGSTPNPVCEAGAAGIGASQAQESEPVELSPSLICVSKSVEKSPNVIRHSDCDMVPPSDPQQAQLSPRKPSGSPTSSPEYSCTADKTMGSERSSQDLKSPQTPSRLGPRLTSPKCLFNKEGNDSLILSHPCQQYPRVAEERVQQPGPGRNSRGSKLKLDLAGLPTGREGIFEPARNQLESQHTQAHPFESSMTPDGLLPMDSEKPFQMNSELPVVTETDYSIQEDTEHHHTIMETEGSVLPEEECVVVVSKEGEKSSAETDADTSQVCMVRKKGKKAQRLDSSESEPSSDEDEKLPSLQQIFHQKPTTQTIDLQSQHCSVELIPSSTSQKNSEIKGSSIKPEGRDREASEGEIVPSSLEPLCQSKHCPPEARRETLIQTDDGEPDECLGGSQDLFGTPEEDETNTEMTAGDSAEFSQYSSEFLNTQQKVEMKAELRRLEDMMAVVSEALRQKEEAEAGAEMVGGVKDKKANGYLETGLTTSVEGARDEKAYGAGDLAMEKTSLPAKEHELSHSGTPSRDESGDPSSPLEAIGPTPPNVTHTQILPKDRTSAAVTGCADRSERLWCEAPCSPMPKSFQLVLSGLTGPQQVEVKRFAKKMGGNVTSQVTCSTTHVVMRTDEELVCERTLKYFQGIAHRKWIVSHLWVSECVKQGNLVDEAEFEVRGDVVNGCSHRGPEKARCTPPNNLLMRGLEICFYGTFTGMTKGQMEEMITLCGGSVVQDLPHFSGECLYQIVIVPPDQESITSLNLKDVPGRAVVVNRGWLLDSLATYTLKDPESYWPEGLPSQ